MGGLRGWPGTWAWARRSVALFALVVTGVTLAVVQACSPDPVGPPGSTPQVLPLQQSACASGPGSSGSGPGTLAQDYGPEDGGRTLEAGVPGGSTAGGPGGGRTVADVRVESGPTLVVAYYGAPFRCDQEVVAVRTLEGQTLSVTFQPRDMDPKTVPRCTCQFDLEVRMGDLLPGTYHVVVRHQADNYGGARAPTLVAEGDVTL